MRLHLRRGVLLLVVRPYSSGGVLLANGIADQPFATFPATVYYRPHCVAAWHGIDVFTFPVHSGPFQTRFNDILVRTLNHARTDRPAITPKLRVLHHGFSLTEVVQLHAYLFLLSQIIW